MSASSSTAPDTLDAAVAAARACVHCGDLPLGPRPVLRASATARLLIVGQAPGTRVHASGIPWDDRSGDRLRQWMAIGRDAFYDETRIAILPMGLCYPGRLKNGGDAPPRRECAPLWHDRLLALLPRIELT
ncbi:MAG: uracil-DNA glycosylase family protein, partial [Rhodospirillales bacterium]|nr:uracil-DNA glycosylase family protein [Rhodospirillales bacterium]